MATIHWFEERQAFIDAASRGQADISSEYVRVAESIRVDGHCSACLRKTTFQVRTDTALQNPPNLREGMCCEHCGLTARQRLMMTAIRHEAECHATPVRGALLEETTLLYQRTHAAWPWLIGSEYLGDDRVSGQHYKRSPRWWRRAQLRHESITSLSYATGSLDLLAHSDVLEHVYDTAAALQESARVLREGGVTVFTVPVQTDRLHSLLRGRPLPHGDIEHLEPPEYHGDGMRSGGIYTFHTLGWDLLDRMRDAGFRKAEIGFCHAPDEGLCPTSPDWRYLPTLFRATK